MYTYIYIYMYTGMIISIYVSLPVYVSASACINMYLKNDQVRASLGIPCREKGTFATPHGDIAGKVCHSFPEVPLR